MAEPPDIPPDPTTPRRVRALVALRLLETLQEQDRPGDIMEEEDLAATMPRRLGLSEVVERQIKTYRADVRKGLRLTDSEIIDLFRLVIRRPDAEDVFFKVGQVLAGRVRRSAWLRFAPQAVRFAVARHRVRRGLRRLFGRRVGGFSHSGFILEGRSLLFYDADPGGDACLFVSGFCESILRDAMRLPVDVRHTRCQSRGDATCRWEGLVLEEAAVTVDARVGKAMGASPDDVGADAAL